MRKQSPLLTAQLLALVTMLFGAVLAQAATTTTVFKVLIDSDNSAATGCTVGTVSGIDQVLLTTVQTTGSTTSVTKVELQQCAGGSLSAPVTIDATGWPVGTRADGRFVVETHIPYSAFGTSLPSTMRLWFQATTGASTSSVLQQVNGDSIAFSFPSDRRDRAVRSGGVRTITLDGNDADWVGVPPLVPGVESASHGALKFTNIYAYPGSHDLFFYLQYSIDANAPIAVDDAYSVRQGGSITIAAPGVLGNDSNPGGGTLTAAVAIPPALGVLVLAPNGAFSYTQNGTLAPSDSFQYTASNATSTSNTAKVALAITPNTAPVAVPDSYSVARGLTITVPPPGVLGNDTDAEGDALTSNLVTLPAHGSVSLQPNGSFSYTHDDSNTVSDSFKYVANDGILDSNATTVTLTILPRNHAPSFTAGPNETALDTAGAQTFVNWATAISAGPPDEAGQALNFIVSNNNNALFAAQPAISPGGTLTFTPTVGQNGVATVTVQLHDNGGTANGGIDTSPPRTFTITVDKIPVITSGNATTFQTGVAGTFSVTASARPPADIFESGALPAGVTFVNNAPPSSSSGTLAGTPGPGTGGVYPISFTATNVHGSSAPQAFTLTVNQPPAITSANTATFTTGQAGTFTITTIGFPLVATIGESGALPAGATFTNNGNGTATLAGTPGPGTGGTYSITLSASNGVLPNAAQTFTLVVDQAPAITSGSATNFAAGVPATFAITTTGFPAPAINETGALPSGITLTDNGNGTASLGGSAAQGAGGVYGITLHATNAAGTAPQTFTITVCNTIVVTNPATTTGVAGAAFTQIFTQTGAVGGATFTTASTLPTGLTLSTAGVLSGTPTQTGTFPVTVTVTDANGCVGSGAVYNLTITCQTITVTNPATTTGVAAAAFSQTFTQSGAIGGATFSTTSTLPTGLTLSTAGVLSGTPTQTGSFPIVVKVTDSNGCTGNGATYTLTITCQTITVTNPLGGGATAGSPFSATFTQTGAIGATTFTLASGVLPAGLTLAANGTLSGTPTVIGSFPITVTATDANGCSGTGGTYDLGIGCPTITVNYPAPGSGTVSAPFSVTFTQSGAVGTATFSVAGGLLPTGVTLSSAGVLSGTPTQSGSFSIQVQVTDANGCIGVGGDYPITIACQTINVTNPVTTTGTVSAGFSAQFTQTGAVGGATFTLNSGTLPTGLTLATDGTLSGTPLQAGSFPITVLVTDGNSCTGVSATYNLFINCQTITVTNPATSSFPAGSAINQTFAQTGAVGGATFTTASTLPTGLSLALNGTLSGTPTQSGTFPIDVTVTDGNGCTGTNTTYNLVMVCQSITVTNPGVTTGTTGTPFNQIFTQTGALGATTFATSSTLPTGLTLAANGTLSGTPTRTGTFPIVVTVTDANGCPGTGSTYSLVIGCGIVTVNNPVATTGTAGTPFSQTFTATGTNGTVTFTLASGSLPAGLSLSTGGVLSGTPLQVGSFPITVTATDSPNGCSGTGTTYTLVIGCQTINVTNPATTAGAVNAAFSQTFTQTSAIGGATFAESGPLPTGLTFHTGTGVLDGTPTQTGTFPIVVTVTDGNGCTGTGLTYNLFIGCQTITVTDPGVTTGTVSSPFSQTFTQTGGFGTTTFSTLSTLPSGLSLASDGTLSGSPLVTGPFPIVVTATDSNGCTGTGATYTLVVACQTITVTDPVNATGPAGSPFSETFSQTGGIGTTTFSETGTLPTGMTFHTGTGVLDGTPMQGGTFPITVTATDSNGCTGSGPTYNLVITCPTIIVTNPATTTGTAGTPFGQTFTQSGGVGTITFSILSGTLPAGLTFHPATGVLDGTPTQTGSFPIVVRATDQNGCTGDGTTYTLVVSCQTINVSNPATTTGTAGTAFSQMFTQGGAIGGATFTLNSGSLPAGLTLHAATGVLDGTPTVTGSFPITVKVTDGNGCTGIGGTYTLVIGCQVITVINPATTTGTILVPFSQTFTQLSAIGGATFTLNSGALPAGLTLHSVTGVLDGTPTVTGSFPITVLVTDGNGCTGVGATYNLVISCQTIIVTNPATTTGTVNAPFTQLFTQTGANGTATFTTGSTVPGLSLATDGTLSGTPTQPGTFPIVITVTDSNGCTGTSPTYTLIISCQTITVTNPATTTGTVGTLFSQTFGQSGGIGTTTFSESGTLPTGLTFHTATGVLDGTPTQSGSFPIAVTATDSNSCTGTGSTYTLVIACNVINVTNPGVSNGTVDASFSQTFTQVGGNGTITWSKVGAIPAGMTFHATTGVLDGTPGVPGSFPITVTATDANGCTGSGATYTLVIACQTITVNPPGVTTGTVDTLFSQSFAQSGVGTHTPAVFTINSGSLPSGLTLSAAGVLSGTPGAPGSFPITVKVTDSNGCTGISATYTLVIACQTINVTNPVTTSGAFNAAFSQTFTQSGVGTHTPANFTINSGTLPTGLSLSTAGVLSGTPSQTGTFPITVKVTDANLCSGTGATYNLAITPVVAGDSYSNLVDNTQAFVSGGATAAPGTPAVSLTGFLTANDLPAGGVSVTAGTVATTAGGSVTILADGTFIYTPKANPGAAATTSDSFTYTGTSNTGGTLTPTTANGTVTLTLANRVWYVKNNGAGTNGQSQSPFNTLAAAAAASTANDIIFVYNGNGTNGGQNAGISLKSGQQLLGEINGLTVNAQTLVAVGTRPTIGNSAGDGISVPATAGSLTGVFIKGLAVAGTANGINISSSGANTLTATVDNVVVNNATANNGIKIAAASTLTSTVTVQNSTVNAATQNGIDAQQTSAGNLVLSINNDTVTATGTGININGAGSTATTITNFANNAVSGNTGGSGITVSTATFDATPGGTFQTVSGGTTVIGASGNGVGSSGMVLVNVSGDLSFTDLDIVTSNGTGLFANGTTPYTGSAGFQIAVGAGVATIDATGGPAADLNTVTANLPWSTIKSANSATTGVSLVTVPGTFTAGAGSSITNATTTDFNINGSNATVTYDGTITDTTGRVVSIASTTGGTKSFTGAITNNGGTGISLTSNTGATINFSGTIILSTGSSDAFTATGGGTVSSTDTNSTLTTTTGTALNVTNTTIGASGLNFKSISANGGANGIVLNNTGASGGLTVNGDGANTSVGGNSTGGTISNMSGANGTIAGSGIYLNSTKNVVLRRMTINGTNQNFGIRGFSVTGFTLEYSTVNGTNGVGVFNTFPDDSGEGSIYFGNTVTTGIIGSGTFTNNNISGGAWDNMHIENTSGTATITVKGNTFGLNGSLANGANISMSMMARNSATLNAVVGGPAAGEPNTFTGAPGGLANFTGQTGTTMDVQFKNNIMSNSHPNNNVGGGCLTVATQGVMTFTVDGNSMQGEDGSTMTIQKASAGTSMQGRITNNTLGVTGVLNSASKSGNGLFLSCAGGGTIGLTILNNDIRNWHGNAAMFFDNTGGSYTANFTIQSNTMAEPGAGSFSSLALTNGGNLTSDTVNVCATIGGAGSLKNTITGTAALADLYLGSSGQNGGHTFNLPGYVGASNLANVQTFVTGNNTFSGGAVVQAYDDNGGQGSFTGVGSSCPTP